MSKHDITTVCTLAAHLMQHADHFGHSLDPVTNGEIKRRGYSDWMPWHAALHAMELQRLGRSARNNAKRYQDLATSIRHDAQVIRIQTQAKEILSPYGLQACVYDTGVHVLGLIDGDYII